MNGFQSVARDTFRGDTCMFFRKPTACLSGSVKNGAVDHTPLLALFWNGDDTLVELSGLG